MKQEELRIGRIVQSNREFSGVPAGTIGEIVRQPNSYPDTDSVAIAWRRHQNDTLVDWFSLDDLQYLDVKANG